jgi:hypothetical protein
MASFSYNTAAELFPAAIRKKKRAGFAYRRFGTAAEAVRFAIEELPADSLNGAYLQVDEARFDQSGIRTLYESQDFPLPRRPRAPEPAPAGDKADADAAEFNASIKTRPRVKPEGMFFPDHALARLLVHPAPQ